MSDIRPELSKSNKYYVSRHRYYELKYFCLQYDEWKKELDFLERTVNDPKITYVGTKSNSGYSDPTYKSVEKILALSEKIELVRKTCNDVDPGIDSYILEAVTKGRTYDFLRTKMNIPCGRGYYYDRYRKFFWLLNYRKD